MAKWLQASIVVLISMLGISFLLVGTLLLPFHFAISLVLGILLLVGAGLSSRIWQV